MSIFSSGISKGAYQGELTCPYSVNAEGKRDMITGDRLCGSKAIRFVENVTPTRLRYRCRKCGGTFQYDISNRADINPYAAYQKGKIWSNILKVAQGRQLKGAFK